MSDQDIAKLLIEDRKRDRRWKNIRFFCWIFIILLFAILIYAPISKSMAKPQLTTKPYVSLVRLNGTIMANRDFSARKVLPILQKAFADKKAKGVVLVINSPGGSPVQASIIHDKIMQLKKKYNKKVVVIGQDTLASGAYLVATAADKIYVHRDTLTGSIGVIMSGFGFADAIKKLGISRRVFTAGNNKDRLDPFKTLSPADKEKIEKLLTIVHQNFINDVEQGRKGKLHGNPKELFSGDFWTGQQAVKLGLADGTGNLWTILPEEFNVTHYKVYSRPPSFVDIILKGAETTLKNVHIGLLSQTPHLQAAL